MWMMILVLFLKFVYHVFDLRDAAPFVFDCRGPLHSQTSRGKRNGGKRKGKRGRAKEEVEKEEGKTKAGGQGVRVVHGVVPSRDSR